MKQLAITFGVALAIILGTMIYGTFSEPQAQLSLRQTKTVLTLDEQQRPITAVTYAAQGDKWVPVAKTETSYGDLENESIDYLMSNCEWTPQRREVAESVCGIELGKRLYQMGADGAWQLTAQRSSDDLSLDDGLVDDVVFDTQGRVVMKATYAWDATSKVGLQKTEYNYEGGRTKEVTSYVWSGADWRKDAISQVVVGNGLAQ